MELVLVYKVLRSILPLYILFYGDTSEILQWPLEGGVNWGEKALGQAQMVEEYFSTLTIIKVEEYFSTPYIATRSL